MRPPPEVRHPDVGHRAPVLEIVHVDRSGTRTIFSSRGPWPGRSDGEAGIVPNGERTSAGRSPHVGTLPGRGGARARIRLKAGRTVSRPTRGARSDRARPGRPGPTDRVESWNAADRRRIRAPRRPPREVRVEGCEMREEGDRRPRRPGSDVARHPPSVGSRWSTASPLPAGSIGIDSQTIDPEEPSSSQPPRLTGSGSSDPPKAPTFPSSPTSLGLQTRSSTAVAAERSSAAQAASRSVGSESAASMIEAASSSSGTSRSADGPVGSPWAAIGPGVSSCLDSGADDFAAAVPSVSAWKSEISGANIAELRP